MTDRTEQAQLIEDCRRTTMDRTTAVTTWRAVCGRDTVMNMPPTGRTLEEFARRIEAAERQRCANVLGMRAMEAANAGHAVFRKPYEQPRVTF